MGLTNIQELALGTAEQSFWNSYNAIADPFEGLVYTKTSNQKTSTLPRLGAAPMPEEWQGDRNAKPVIELSFDITNLPWDSTISIDKEVIQYQQWDEVASVGANQGMKAAAHKTKKLSAIIEAGTTGVGDDGLTYFTTVHIDPGAAYQTGQDNDRTSAIGAALTPTDLEFAAAIRGGFGQFYGFKDDQGDPFTPVDLNPANWIVMVPTDLTEMAQRVRVADSLTGPVGNDLMDRFTVRTNQFLTNQERFYMFYAGMLHKPVIVQESKGLSFEANIDPHNADLNMSAGWWGETAYGQWRTALLHIFTTA